MIRLLIFCALTQNAITNILTSKEIAEAYKYFESLHAKNNADTLTNNGKKVVTVSPNSKDLLSVLHYLRPLPLPNIRPPETKPLLESREDSQEVSNQEDDLYNEGFNQENFVNSASVKEKENEEVIKGKSLNWIKKLVLRNGAERKPNKIYWKNRAEKRRMFEWFNNLFGRGNSTTTTELYNLEVQPKLLNDSNKANVTEVLATLNNVLVQLNQNIVDERLKANKTDAFFILKLPVKPKTSTNDVHFRRKREIATKNIASNNAKTFNNGSETLKDREVTNDQSKRHRNEVTVNNFKTKILAHLMDSFNEIKYKIAPLTKVKENHSSNDLYKIGYIAANVDTLQENLNRLMKELEEEKYIWDEKKILEFFDKLKTSNSVLRTLMEYLEKLTEKKQVYEEVKEFEE